METKYEVIDIPEPKSLIEATEWTWSQIILSDEDMRRQALEECNKRNGFN
jgi:hypothetical protein